MGCHALSSVQTQGQYPKIDTLQFSRVRYKESGDNILSAILPYFKSLNRSDNDRQVFYDKMALKLGELYSDTFLKLQNALKQEKISHDEIRIKFSKKILLSIINTIGELQKMKNWKKQRVEVFKGISTCQKKIIDFLQYKYPRNKPNCANAELMEMFQDVNNSEHTDYDLLINSGIYFDDEMIRTYEKKEVLSKIKKFLNQMINQTNRFHDAYRSSMEKLFDKLEGGFVISRKIPQSTPLFADINSQSLDINSPQIFRIVVKWIESLEDIFLNTQENLRNMKFLKIMEQSEEEVSYFPLYTGKEEIISIIGQLLQKCGAQYRKQQEQHQSSLANFNDLAIQVINANMNMPEIDINQLKVLKYASYNSDFVEFLAEEKLAYLISQLTFMRSMIEKKCRKAVDLIRCNIMDLLRSRFMGSKKQIITVFNRMKELEKQDKIKIIRIKNRLETPLNDVLINYVFTDSFLICEIQLVLQENNNIMNQKEKVNGQFNHILYECLRSIFGPIAEMSLMVTYRDTLMGFQKKIEMDKHQLQHLRCQQNDVLVCEYELDIPYICSLCNIFYSAHENSFPVHRCSNCNFYVCPQCLFEYDQEIKNECYIKEVISFIKQNLHEVPDDEEEGFIFFDKKFHLVCKLNENQKNYVDKIEELMLEEGKKYAFVLKIQNGVKRMKCYSIASGSILPVFYDYLPKITRKKFKQELFGPYDIVLFLNEKIKVQSRPYTQAFMKDCFTFDETYEMKRKVKQIFYFSWADNRYMIDVGEQVRESDLNRTKMNGQENSLKGQEILQHYKRVEKKLELDYMDLQKINLEGTLNQMKDVRHIKLKSNYLKTIDNVLVLQKMEEISAERNEIMNLKLNKTLPKLRIIDLSENFIDSVAGITQKYLPKLKILNLQANNIQVFPTIDLEQLSTLNLNDNKLESIMTFKDSKLPRLKKLSLNNNNIEIFPLLNLPNIREIQANSNRIQEIQWLEYLPSIQKISLNKNRITKMPALHLKLLQYILIEENMLEDVSRLGQCQIPNIKNLQFSRNSIKYFPAIKFLELMVLNISRNQISNIQSFQSSEFESLKFLDCSHNNIEAVPKIEAEYLETINLQRNQIKQLEKLPLCNLPRIQQIDISENQIEKLPKLSFETLEFLNLKRNSIESIKQFMNSELPSLHMLNLSQNSIRTLQGAQFPELVSFDIHSNNIREISEIRQQHFKNCVKMDLSDNKIIVLPKFTKCKLEKLFLQKNCIERFEGFEQSCLGALEILDLRHNHLNNFLPLKFPKLLSLNLCYNRMTETDGISKSQLGMLQLLYITNNMIEEVSVFNFSSLSYVDFSCNQISSIQNLQRWRTPEIKQLNFRNNKIQKLYPLSSKGLSQLIVSENKITDITNFCQKSILPKLLILKLNNNTIAATLPIMKFNSLKRLELKGNKITDIKRFADKSVLNKLNILKLSNNCLIDVDYFHQNFKKLKELHLDNNQINQLGEFPISQLAYLRLLDLSNNCLTSLPKFHFNQLVILNAQNNQIAQIGQFAKSHNKSLCKLNLANNLISKWLVNAQFVNLVELNLEKNKLVDTSQFISSNLPQLQELDIRNNEIQEQKANIELPKLLHLHLVANQFQLGKAFQILQANLSNKNLLDTDHNDYKSSKKSNHSSIRSSYNKIQKKIKLPKK